VNEPKEPREQREIEQNHALAIGETTRARVEHWNRNWNYEDSLSRYVRLVDQFRRNITSPLEWWWRIEPVDQEIARVTFPNLLLRSFS
jgi:hypothetical protein